MSDTKDEKAENKTDAEGEQIELDYDKENTSHINKYLRISK